MRLIWEKELDLTKNQIRGRLNRYLIDHKYLHMVNDESILLHCEGIMRKYYFQIFYKEGTLRIEGWMPKRKKERTTSSAKNDILRKQLEEFIALFIDTDGSEQLKDDMYPIRPTEYEAMTFPGYTQKDEKRYALYALLYAFFVYLPMRDMTNTTLQILCIGSIYFAYRGIYSSRRFMSYLSFNLAFVTLLTTI